MEDFKGTRGKWEVDPYDKSLVRSTNADNGQIAECHSPDGFCQDIAYVWDGHWEEEENREEAEANDQLIATAPELLQAAIDIDKYLSLKSVIPKELIELNRVINKALGKEADNE